MGYNKLVPSSVARTVPPLMSQDGKGMDATVHLKFFNPCGSATWWITELDPKTGEAFGYVTGMSDDEWGGIDLNELAAVRGPLGLGIERDLHFSPKPLREALAAHGIEA
jgi:hypothetical protein